MKALIKRAIRRLGYDIQRYETSFSEAIVLGNFFSYHNVDLILDVGANVGQFVKLVRNAGYKGKIISFEPLAAAHVKLTTIALRDPQLAVWPRMAIGNQNGEIQINVAGNSQSSSVLPMLKSHLDAAPDSRYVATERVKVSRLDSCISSELAGSTFPYLKIDTQGYELPVIEGAAGILTQIKAIQLELSLIPLFEGQALLLEMLGIMKRLGFDLYAIIPGFIDKRSGRMLQCDGIFISGSSI